MNIYEHLSPPLIVSLFQRKEVVSHDSDTSMSCTYYGFQFKLQVSGKAKQFSWSNLISEVVISPSNCSGHEQCN